MRIDVGKVDPLARRLALVPVIVIAGSVIAYLLGFRLEGRAPVVVTWRTHTVAESAFTVAAPGMLITYQQTMNFDGRPTLAQTHVVSELGADFIVSIVQRRAGDNRPTEVMAANLGLSAIDAPVLPGGLAMFGRDYIEEGKRTQARMIFRDRTVYQLMVTSPEAVFPLAGAGRFFESFRLLGKT